MARLIICCALFSAVSTGATVASSAEEIVLQFPQESSVGWISICPLSHHERMALIQETNEDTDEIRWQRARGEIVMPADTYVGLEVAGGNAADLSFLGRLPADALESLSIYHAPLSKEHFKWISQQKSLRKLELYYCEVSPGALDQMNGAPAELEHLTVYRKDNESNFDVELAQWAASLRKLQRLHCTPSLNAQAIYHLGDHPALMWTNVHISADSGQLLENLARLPALAELSVIADEKIGPQFAKQFASLPPLIDVYWYGGVVDGELLRALSQGGQLKKLRVHEFEMGEGILEAVETLSSLHHFMFSPLDDELKDPQLAELPKVLLRLPELRTWPALYRLDAATLYEMVRHQQIESLDIHSIADDVTPADLLQIAQLKNLRHLQLHWVPFDDLALEQLANLEKLNSLTLWGTGAKGIGFAALHNLPQLKRITFYPKPFSDPQLASLFELSQLTELVLGGENIEGQLEPLRNCQNLQRLQFIHGVHVDDALVEGISELKGLQSLVLGDECLITDEGAQHLSTMPALNRLSVGGRLTTEGVAALASMPSMRKLSAQSLTLSETEVEILKERFPWLGVYARQASRSTYQMILLGADGFLRAGELEERTELDRLEGLAPPDLQGETPPERETVSLADLSGKVVLVEFWGTWCGPCRSVEPRIVELYDKHHNEGLEIVSVHTQNGAEQLPAYLVEHPLPWHQLIDAEGKTVEAYHVPHYPSFYMIDRKSKLRVAGVHRHGLEETIEALLNE